MPAHALMPFGRALWPLSLASVDLSFASVISKFKKKENHHG